MLKPAVEVKNADGFLVAEFWDCLRLDPAPVRDLRQHYESHIRAKGKADLIVDLNGVSYAGSASLGGFLALHRLALQQGGRVIFCNVDESVHEVFRISKLIAMFSFVEDLPAAFAMAASGPASTGTASARPPATAPSPRSDGPLRRLRRGDGTGA